MELDNRGLEPPLPMVRTLEALALLAPGETLRVRNDRVPVYLLPQLDARGVAYQIVEQPEGGVVLTLTQAVAEP